MESQKDETLEKKFQDLAHYLDRLNQIRDFVDIKTIYHYTDINGFLGIFQHHKFWSSNALFLNDSLEIKYGLELALKKINEGMTGNTDDYVNVLTHETGQGLQQMLMEGDLYVTSFCSNGDLLSQWRGYASGIEGVSIGFNLKDLRSSISRGYIYKVIYDPDMQKEAINRIYLLLRDLIDYSKRKKAKHFLKYFRLWISVLQTIILTFKDESFSEENEWRLIVHQDTFQNQDTPIQYRSKNNYILPYIAIDIHNFEKTIDSIITSPSQREDLVHESIHFFLKKNGYDPELFTHSSIPFRK